MPTEHVAKSPLLRTPDAARYLGLSTSLLEKLRQRGEGPTYVKIGRAIVYDPCDLDDWIDRNKVPPCESRPPRDRSFLP
jgi:predicted DNA-binding transcriptional regulator AlpA